MMAYKTEATLDSRTLTLRNLPFPPGTAVEVIVLERIGAPDTTTGGGTDAHEATPLAGTVLRYDDPFEPAVPPEDWDAIGNPEPHR